MNKTIATLIFVIISLFYTVSFADINDFDISDSTIDVRDLISGGPQKDGVPAISGPVFVVISEVDFLYDEDLLVIVAVDNQTKAYPLKVLNWHEIVNDYISGVPVAVTWCPLTRSAIVFNRIIGAETLEFGVSGFLYQNNLVMYDRTHSGLWPQLQMGAASGKLSGKYLSLVPSKIITWADFKNNHSDGLVLSSDTGYVRRYDVDPYLKYRQSPHVMFPMANSDDRFTAKSLVIGVKINDTSKAYPLNIINQLNNPIEDVVAGKKIKVYSSSSKTAYITDEDGKLLPAITVYWFAWSAFYADTLVYEGNSGGANE